MLSRNYTNIKRNYEVVSYFLIKFIMHLNHYQNVAKLNKSILDS